MFLKTINKFKYILIIIILITTFSCRKDKAFIIKKNDITTEEEINLIKNIETRLLIWRNKKNYSTLNKYLNAKEEYIKFSKHELKDRLFLSEYYFYLSFMTRDKKEKIYALEKGVLNSKLILKSSSKEYQKESDRFTQDYKIINLVNKKESKALYWYINNIVFLRNEMDNLILYKDDLTESFKYFYQISKNKDKIFSEAIFLYNLPIIGGKDEKTASEILKSLKENEILSLFIKTIFLTENKENNLKILEKSLNLRNFRDQIFKESFKLIFDKKK